MRKTGPTRLSSPKATLPDGPVMAVTRLAR